MYFCFIDCAKAFDWVDQNKLLKFLKRWDYQFTLPASFETSMQVKKEQLEPEMEQQTGSKLGKEYFRVLFVVVQSLSVSNSLRPHGLQHTGSPVLQYLPEFAQIHVCWVTDAI